MFSPLISKRIFMVPILAMIVAMQLLLVRSVSSKNQTNAYLHHICSNDEGKYKPKSPYERNLNNMIRGIHKNKSNFKKGFVYAYHGEEPYTAYTLLQCRGDSYDSKCGSCFTKAASELGKRCPMNKAGIVWFDECLFKISPTDFSGEIDDKNKFSMCSKKKASDPASFNEEIKSFLKTLVTFVTSDFNELKLYQPGRESTPEGKLKLEGMVQCTKDLDVKACKKCLDEITAEFPECCNGKEGGRIMTGSCNFRYEIYPFLYIYNWAH